MTSASRVPGFAGKGRKFAVLAQILLAYGAGTSEAWAYIDPGSGTIILQVLAAIGVGALFYFNRFKETCVRVYRNVFGRGDTSEPKSDNR